MIDTIKARLKMLRITTPRQLTAKGIDVDPGLHYIRLAAEVTADEIPGYTLLTRQKPS